MNDEELVELLVLLRDPRLARLHLGVREVGHGLLSSASVVVADVSPAVFANTNWSRGRS